MNVVQTEQPCAKCGDPKAIHWDDVCQRCPRAA
jgi:hypothetical protein